jgi:hypothetical protein
MGSLRLQEMLLLCTFLLVVVVALVLALARSAVVEAVAAGLLLPQQLCP